MARPPYWPLFLAIAVGTGQIAYGASRFLPVVPFADHMPPGLLQAACNHRREPRYRAYEWEADRLRQRARQGEAKAQFLLTRAMPVQTGAEEAEMVSWLRQSAEQGFAPAQRQIGLAHLEGVQGIAADPAAARDWLGRAAQGGDRQAQYWLAGLYRDGVGGPRDDAAASAALLAAARRCHPQAQVEAAFRLHEGVGVARDPGAARAYARVGRSNGGDPWEYAVRLTGAGREAWPQADAMRARAGEDSDVLAWGAAAYELAREAEAEGSPAPRTSGGVTFRSMSPNSPKIVARLDLVAAHMAHPPAQNRLAERYRDGDGVEANRQEAAYWSDRAAANPLR